MTGRHAIGDPQPECADPNEKRADNTGEDPEEVSSENTDKNAGQKELKDGTPRRNKVHLIDILERRIRLAQELVERLRYNLAVLNAPILL